MWEKWEREGERTGEKVRDRVWDEEREREREREVEPRQSKRLELCSPVVCTRWCSLIIHCMRWMSLSPHTALLHSTLCLSAPGGRRWGWGELYRPALGYVWMFQGWVLNLLHGFSECNTNKSRVQIYAHVYTRRDQRDL